ncbi:MAG TPA: SH3 domain-containing protein [Anaerolineae bacterium]
MSKITAMLVVLLVAVLTSGCTQVQGAVATFANAASVILAIPTAGPAALPPPVPTDPPSLALSLPVTIRVTVAPTPTRPAAPEPAATRQPAAAGTPAPGAPANVEAVVVSGPLNVRGAPGMNSPIVAVLDQADQVSVVGRTMAADWFELRLADGRTGWVSAQYVQLRPAATTIAAAAPAPRPAAVSLPIPAPASAAPTVSGRPLEVSFINPHYECENRTYELHPDTSHPLVVHSRRSFQFDLYVKNVGSQAVAPPWRPSRWTITDGGQEFATTITLEWPDHNGNPYPQPVIFPGQMAGWTFRTVQLLEGQWVKSVDFTWNGETYHQNFDLGPYGHSYNYRDCDR